MKQTWEVRKNKSKITRVVKIRTQRGGWMLIIWIMSVKLWFIILTRNVSDELKSWFCCHVDVEVKVSASPRTRRPHCFSPSNCSSVLCSRLKRTPVVFSQSWKICCCILKLHVRMMKSRVFNVPQKSRKSVPQWESAESGLFQKRRPDVSNGAKSKKLIRFTSWDEILTSLLILSSDKSNRMSELQLTERWKTIDGSNSTSQHVG